LQHKGGVNVLLTAGTATVVIGGFLLLPELAFGDVFCDQDPECSSAHSRNKARLLGVLAGGLFVALVGTIVFLHTPPTRYTVVE
jgi:hypothetical protein